VDNVDNSRRDGLLVNVKLPSTSRLLRREEIGEGFADLISAFEAREVAMVGQDDEPGSS
jgi:hypothetical protein